MKNLATLQQALRDSKARLYPSLRNPNYLILRRRRELFRQWLTRVPGDRLYVLDIGGRLQPYRALIADRVARYLSVDVRETPLVGVLGDAENLPVASESFDVAICTQVLEYLPNPEAAVGEIHRVLRPGGYLLLSAPTSEPVTSDADRWRFTRPGLLLMLRRFSQIEVSAEGSSVTGFFRTFNRYLDLFAASAAISAIFSYTVYPAANLCGCLVEMLARSHNDDFSVNFSVFARK